MCFLQCVNFSGLLKGHEISAVLFIKGLKEVQISKYCRFEICIEFLFFIQFWCAFSLNWLCCKLQVVCWLISPISYSFWDNLDRKGLKSAKFECFYFELQFNFFLNNSLKWGLSKKMWSGLHSFYCPPKCITDKG